MRSGVMTRAGRANLLAHQFERLGVVAVGMNIDGLGPLAIDHDLAAPARLPLRRGRAHQPASGEGNAGAHAGGLAEQFPARRHHVPLNGLSLRAKRSNLAPIVARPGGIASSLHASQ
jgi:hypothetical protein